LFPEKVQAEWQLSNGHARSCAPKLPRSHVSAVSSGIPAAKSFVPASTSDKKKEKIKLVLQPRHVDIAVLTLEEAYGFSKEVFVKLTLYYMHYTQSKNK